MNYNPFGQATGHSGTCSPATVDVPERRPCPQAEIGPARRSHGRPIPETAGSCHAPGQIADIPMCKFRRAQ